MNDLPVLWPNKPEFAATAVKRLFVAVQLIYQLVLVASHWIGCARSPGALSLTLELIVSIPH